MIASGVPVTPLVGSVALIALNGFFVAAEFSLLASSRTRIAPLAEEGRLTAIAALRATGRLGVMLAGFQLGVTVSSLALGSVAEPALDQLFEGLFSTVGLPAGAATTASVVVSLAVVVFAHLLFGEMIPKSLALADPERTLFATILPAQVFVAVFGPVISVLNLLARGGARLFGATPADELRSAHTAAEIQLMLKESREEGLLEAEETDLLASALRFAERRVAEVMVPVERIVAVSLDASVGELERVVVESGHSRVLVRSPGSGRLVGFVHVKDLLGLESIDATTPIPRSVVRLTFSVGPDEELDTILVRMRATQRHLALVVDPDRNPIGLVTLEDVVESIVGDITDESDRVERRD